jgi:hypothetical protein
VLLATLDAAKAEPPAERLRSLRAVEALESMGGREAKRLLRGLAEGVPGATQTRAAQLSLQRLAAWAARRP